MRRWILCVLLGPLLFLSCDAGGADDDGDMTPFAFTELYTLMSETGTVISEISNYANPAYDSRGYVFVQSDTNSISVFAAVGLTRLGDFEIDSGFSGPAYSLHINLMKCANNRLYVSTGNKLFVFDTTDPVPTAAPYTIAPDGTEGSFWNLEIVGDYVYVACAGGLSIFKDTGLALERKKTIVPSVLGEATLSFVGANIFSRNGLLHVFTYKGETPPFDKHLVFDLSNQENPTLLSSQPDSHFYYHSVRLFDDHFISAFSSTISIFEIGADGKLTNIFDELLTTADRVYKTGDKLLLEEKCVFNTTDGAHPVLLCGLTATLKYNHFIQPNEKDLYFVHIINTDDMGTPNNFGDDISTCSLAHYSLLK